MVDAGVLVMTSIWEEPFGLATVEAFARGRPVIATAFGASRRLVADTNGWLVEADPAALAAALTEAATVDCSARAAGARRRYEERFTPEIVVAELIRNYEE